MKVFEENGGGGEIGSREFGVSLRCGEAYLIEKRCRWFLFGKWMRSKVVRGSGGTSCCRTSGSTGNAVGAGRCMHTLARLMNFMNFIALRLTRVVGSVILNYPRA